MRIITLNVPAVAALVAAVAGSVLVVLTVVLSHRTMEGLGWVGYLLVLIGAFAFFEYRIEQVMRELKRMQSDAVTRELAAYEAGRLRGL